MEEKIKDIFNNIKERLSNPFLFSFLIAFLVYNWEITLAIFYNDSEQIKAEGFKSIFEFVRNRWANNGKIGMPIFIAIVYTFVFPIFRNLVNAFQTWIIKWGEEWNLKISKNSKIGIDKYLTLRDNYIEKTKSLGEIIESESKFLVEIETKTKETNELKEKIEFLQRTINNINETDILNGEWEIEYKEKELIKDFEENKLINFGTSDDKRLRIRNSRCYIDVNSKEKLVYSIENFYYNTTNNNITFLKKNINKKDDNFFKANKLNILRFTNDYVKDTLEGFENGVEIKYKKIKNL